ncbi:MAG: hypothetical protein P4L50_21610 [Anaerolineaceae bacterium]|nr:hypothetical protein [Anaerolineaceae bacterium]
MNQPHTLYRYDEFIARGASGQVEDVDLLMHELVSRDDLATSRLVDYALSLVTALEGRQRIKHYLYNGAQIQRNYAALYFKRKGLIDLLDEAVAQGKIDREQAYAG